MKVFVPVSDAMLGARSELCDELVPFDPDFLAADGSSCKGGRKPANWITDSDYATACERLRQHRFGE